MQVFSPKKFGLPFFYRFSTLVLLRHGESQWNLENRFTGWVDVPLSPSGIYYYHYEYNTKPSIFIELFILIFVF